MFCFQTNALEVFSRSLVQLTDLAKDLEGAFGEIIPTTDLVSQLACTTLNGHEDSDVWLFIINIYLFEKNDFK